MRSIFISVLFLVSIVLSQDRTVTFVSQPESCMVFINGTHRGTTPFTTTISDTTDHHLIMIRIQKPGYVREYTKMLIPDLHDTVSTILQRYAAINITTVPESASVFIDSVLYGKTPFYMDTLNPRTILVTVVKQYHSVFAEQLTLESGSVRSISATLEQLRSSLIINSNIPGASYSIDRKPIDDPRQQIDVKYGSHFLSVRDPSTGAVAEKIIVVEEKNPRLFAATLNEFSYGKMVRGFLVPSLNQFEDQNGVKAQVIASAAIASILFYSYAEFQYRSAEKTFSRAQYEYSHQANSIPLAADARLRMEEKHEKLTSAISTVNIARILPIAVWGLNALDVILNHSIINNIEEISGNTSLRFETSGNRAIAGFTLTF